MVEAFVAQPVAAPQQRLERSFEIGARARRADDALARRPFDDRLARVVHHVERQQPNAVARVAHRDERHARDVVSARAAHSIVERKLRFVALAYAP